jgi:hypothetical protein
MDYSEAKYEDRTQDLFMWGVYHGKMLRDETPRPEWCARRRPYYDDPWEVLARLWVRTLLYAAPHGDVEAHRRRLSQGGEFITHLWALCSTTSASSTSGNMLNHHQSSILPLW